MTSSTHTLAGLSVAALADKCDEHGLRHQVLDPAIQLVSGESFLGRAFTLRLEPVAEGSVDWFDVGIEAVDAVTSGSVVVVSTAGEEVAASWGELLSTRVRAAGAVGVVTEGCVRDVSGLREMGFPVCSRGRNARDARGRLATQAYDEPVVCGGVRIDPGDWMFSDQDGVIAVPAHLWHQIRDDALAKLGIELEARDRLRAGASAAEVLGQLGVL
jgi:regulator of RNase E activity RraA